MKSSDKQISIVCLVDKGLDQIKTKYTALLEHSDFAEIILMIDSLSDEYDTLSKQVVSSEKIRVVPFDSSMVSLYSAAVNVAKGEYIIFATQGTSFTEQNLRDLCDKMRQSNADIGIYDCVRQDKKDAALLVNKDSLLGLSTFSSKDIPNRFFVVVSGDPINKIFRKSFLIEQCADAWRSQDIGDVYYVYSAMLEANRIKYIDDISLEYTGTPNLMGEEPSTFHKVYTRLFHSLYDRDAFEELSLGFLNRAVIDCIDAAKKLSSEKDLRLFCDLLSEEEFSEIGVLNCSSWDIYDRKHYIALNELKKRAKLYSLVQVVQETDENESREENFSFGSSNIPFLSVIVPVYNSGKYLRQCIESVLSQSVSNIELILVDDGSTDDSIDIVQEYAKKDGRVQLLTQENSGAGIARNHGLTVALGEYVHFLDSDDYLLPNAYQSYLDAAKVTGADVIKSRVTASDEKRGDSIVMDSYELGCIASKDFNRITSFFEMPYSFVELGVVPWNGIYKKEFLDLYRIRFNNLTCVNDRSFFNNVIIHTRRVVLIPEYTVHHRLGIETSLVGRRLANFECHFESYRIIERQTGFLSDYLRAVVLDRELRDIFYWASKLDDGSEYYDRVHAGLEEFLADIDVSWFSKHHKKVTWMVKYRQFVGNSGDAKSNGLGSGYNCAEAQDIALLKKEIKDLKECNSYRIGRSVTFLPRKIKKVMKRK